MDLQVLSNLRASARGAIMAQYADKPVYTAEITNIADDEGNNVTEFFTVFFSEGEESQNDVAMDSDDYETETQITVGYFNIKGAINQSWLESEAGDIRQAVMNLNLLYGNKIKRGGWQYVPPIDGAIAGIYFHFGFSYKN